jgi:phage shock protein E
MDVMKRLLIFGMLLAGTVGLLLAAGPSREQVQAWRAKGAVVIDVRTPGEYRAGHLPGTTNVPVAEIADRIAKVVPDTNQPVLLHCQSGGRSANAKAILEKQGYKTVENLGSYRQAQALLEPGR